MKKHVYFPVGHQLTTQQLQRFDWADMQQRHLNDPKYAGFECTFNWRNYLSLDFSEARLRNKVSNSLDQISSTPEGQQTIRQAYAMQNYQITKGLTRFDKSELRRIRVTDKYADFTSLYSAYDATIFIEKK